MFRKALPVVVTASKAMKSVYPKNLPARNYAWGNFPIPLTDIRKVMQEMDRRMADMEKDLWNVSPFRGTLVPRMLAIDGVQVRKNRKYSVELNASGFKPEEIKLSLKDGKLRVEANMERSDGDGAVKQSLVHEFTVPPNLDVATVESQLHGNGVLEIVGELKEESGKKIPIEGAGDAAKQLENDDKDAVKSKL